MHCLVLYYTALFGTNMQCERVHDMNYYMSYVGRINVFGDSQGAGNPIFLSFFMARKYCCIPDEASRKYCHLYNNLSS